MDATVSTVLRAFITDWQRFHSTLVFSPYGQNLELAKACGAGCKAPNRQSVDLPKRVTDAEESFFPAREKKLLCRRHSEDYMLQSEQHVVGRSLRMLMSNGSTSADRKSVGAKERMSKYWSESCHPDDHLWDTVTGSAECYVGEKDCRSAGSKLKCCACHLIAHEACLPVLPKKNLKCKSTYTDPWLFGKKIIPNAPMRHHWVHRWTQEGKCLKCGKSFQSKLMGKEMIAITCSWCKASYHNKCKCFDIQLIEQPCDLGALKDVIIPASWINKIPCCRYPPNRRTFSSNASLRRRKRIRKDRIFFVRPIEAEPGTPPMFPLLIFVNIKSGGKKGKKLFEELCWLVNPRQVFELSCGKGPRFALEMYRKCLPRLRIVVCGGDGTVSWVFSCLDGMKIPSSRYPPIAIVPLGTGNDLSQTMGWGSTYFDESIAEVLSVIVHDSKIVKFDRWFIDVSPNSDIEKPADEEKAADSLPVNVMNNYFSIGVDAHIALQFHESRTAKPEIHKSRFKNRLVYGSIGTKDLFKRAWKDLSEYISLECDGIDHTGKIKELGLHCLLILNIPKYAGGTMPWGNQASNLVSLGLWAVNNSIPIPKISVPSYEDGRIEVVGFTAASLAALQVGGRGVRIAQCCYLRLATRKVIPVQVDGEPCKLAPSVITISLFCKVPMLKRISDKEAEHLSNLGLPTEYALPRNNPSSLWDDKTNCSCKVKVSYVAWSTYEKLKNKTAELCEHAKCIGNIDAEYDHDLEYLRPLVNAVLQQDKEAVAPEDWFYLDCSGQDEVYHVDRSYEVFTSVTDISELGGGILIVLIPHEATLAKQSSQSTDEQVNFIQNEMSGISVDNVRCMNSSGAQLPLNQSCFAEKLFNIYSTLDTNEWDVR